MSKPHDPALRPHEQRPWTLPPVGGNPGVTPATTPGSFANRPNIGGPLAFSSPDTEAMPAPSDKTAWNFLPDGWKTRTANANAMIRWTPGKGNVATTFVQADKRRRYVGHPAEFEPVTQLEHARLGTITPQMRRVAEREPHLTAEQVRDEVAAGRMVIPANVPALGDEPRPDVHRPGQQDQGQR